MSMGSLNFMLSLVEHEKSFITSEFEVSYNKNKFFFVIFIFE